MILINTEEYQKKILELMYSEELDKMIESTIYKDNEQTKGAIRLGMALASMYTCRCQQYQTNQPDKS